MKMNMNQQNDKLNKATEHLIKDIANVIDLYSLHLDDTLAIITAIFALFLKHAELPKNEKNKYIEYLSKYLQNSIKEND
jgi:hypothetical protein